MMAWSHRKSLADIQVFSIFQHWSSKPAASWGVHDGYINNIYINTSTIQNKDNTCIAPLSATLHLYHFYLWARQPAAKWSLWRVYPMDLGDGTVEIMPPKSSRKKLVPLICHPQLTRTFHIIHIAFIYPQLIPTPIYCWFLDRLRAHAALFVSGRGPQSSASQMGACLAVACRKKCKLMGSMGIE